MNIDVTSVAPSASDAAAGASGAGSDGAGDEFARMVANLTDTAARPNAEPDAPAGQDTSGEKAAEPSIGGAIGAVIAATGGDVAADDAADVDGDLADAPSAKGAVSANPLPAAVLAALLATRLPTSSIVTGASDAGNDAAAASGAVATTPDACSVTGIATGIDAAIDAASTSADAPQTATPAASAVVSSDGAQGGLPDSADAPVATATPTPQPDGAGPGTDLLEAARITSGGASSEGAIAPLHDPAATQPVAVRESEVRGSRGARVGDDPVGGADDGSDGSDGSDQPGSAPSTATSASSASVTAPTIESISVSQPTSLATPPAMVARAAAVAPTHATSATPSDLNVVDPNVARIGGAVRTLHGGGGQAMSLEMSPADLGRVRIDLVSRDGRIEVVLSAEHHRAADLLRGSTDALRREIEGSGVTLDAVHVGVSSDGGRSSGRGGFDADELASGRGGHLGSSARLAGGGGALNRPVPLSQLRRPVHAGGVDLDL